MNDYVHGGINKTLFVKKDNGNLLLARIYVDDFFWKDNKQDVG